MPKHEPLTEGQLTTIEAWGGNLQCRAVAELRRLRAHSAELLLYVLHDADCRAMLDAKEPCTCGLDEALATKEPNHV